MHARFVPSYYERDLLHKLQQLRHGTKSVEEYYQELQMGTLCCNIEEGNEPAIARFVGGLNREIRDIVEYIEYTNITDCFHIACQAEREVQGRHASARSNISAGKSAPWQRTTTSFSGRAPPPSSSPSRLAPPPPPSSGKTCGTPTNSATKSAPKEVASASSVASTGRARDIQCHRCKGLGHVQHDFPTSGLWW
jgi:hypothetical protein